MANDASTRKRKGAAGPVSYVDLGSSSSRTSSDSSSGISPRGELTKRRNNQRKEYQLPIYKETDDTIKKKRWACESLNRTLPALSQATHLCLGTLRKIYKPICISRDPLYHYCCTQLVLTIDDILDLLGNNTLTYDYLAIHLINLINLHDFTVQRSPYVSTQYCALVFSFVVMVSPLQTALEELSSVNHVSYMTVAHTIFDEVKMVSKDGVICHTKIMPSIAEFQETVLLGAGGFGAAWKAVHQPTNLFCTIKIVKSDLFCDLEPSMAMEHSSMDKVVASVIDHPHVIGYHCCFRFDDAYITIMEYFKSVDLSRVVDKSTVLNINESRLVFAQLFVGLCHLHFRGILHRDIKPSNALINQDGIVRLIDFDLSKVGLGHYANHLTRIFFKRTANEFEVDYFAGTISFAAPETLKERMFVGRAVDWWALGCCLYKFVLGRTPFRGKEENDVKELILNTPLKFPTIQVKGPIVQLFVDLTSKLLEKDATKRLASDSYAEIIGHRFFGSKLNWEQLRHAPVCEIPAFNIVMQQAAGVANPAKIPNDQLRKISPMASPATLERPNVKPSSFKKKPQKKDPLYSFMSPFFRNAVTTRSSGPYESVAPVMEDFTTVKCFTRNAFNENVPKSDGIATDIVILKPTTPKFKVGLKIEALTLSDGRSFYYIADIAEGSAASSSGLCKFDVIYKIEGSEVHHKKKPQVEGLLTLCKGDLLMQVYSQTPCRVAMFKVDFKAFLDKAAPVSVTLQASRWKRFGPLSFSVSIEEIPYTDNSGSATRCFGITSAPANTNILFGDVILSLNGQDVVGVTLQCVNRLMGETSKPLEIVVAATSPLRL